MVRIFGSMGLLEERPGVATDPDFPPVMLVTSYGPDVPRPALVSELAPAAAGAIAPAEDFRADRAANFRSDDEAKSAPRPVRHSRT